MKNQVVKLICPFHEEETPSFTYCLDRDAYKCFGCGKSGTLDELVQELGEKNLQKALDVLGGVVVE
jgi:DNA primase